MNLIYLAAAALLALTACALVPPHDNMPANDVQWRRSVGAML